MNELKDFKGTFHSYELTKTTLYNRKWAPHGLLKKSLYFIVPVNQQFFWVGSNWMTQEEEKKIVFLVGMPWNWMFNRLSHVHSHLSAPKMEESLQWLPMKENWETGPFLLCLTLSLGTSLLLEALRRTLPFWFSSALQIIIEFQKET